MTLSFMHLSITFSSKRFSICSLNMDVGFVEIAKLNVQYNCPPCCSNDFSKRSLLYYDLFLSVLFPPTVPPC
jgi:hypothetical protein